MVLYHFRANIRKHIRLETMQFNDFQKFFVEHQKNYHTKESDRLSVITFGLVGETGEVVEVIKKYIRDGNINSNKLKSELGDLLAYLAIVADYFDLSLEDISKTVIDKNRDRLERNKLHGEGDYR
jgi:NTP pyrophosphatase (non-canonical NTP hydrolase)